ncbi:type I-F CRISPR-associated protein Csy3 [Xanthomonas fragariae]|uniref:Crispr-associated protein, Csy3 family n=1 Tax=Xanthomonas fragariae TaxID=48664 RepID=A0A1Y6HS92_9XANT|nr:type I-F CRISPR-associated protein Csy3 [Xanthomonas fragariae]AOD16021.1 type I-F CRISPR-associated protein Csy3 [Xanthomonas fragariae]AOD19447.1 type I-F CRISPR-associated protein Csy3 [Xanthomonas fragariae]ENZ96950.1 crispr-associated protein, Csy3 family [Xanthomonas fragariae LMG 25863]MBL9197334.1 type I-F CRISPR-associated protein Csy3 [Xanthomonas fragariae]MBL9222282.1 type I-F CRISPR-associated protein Csy3 [Xanthomonas fragariae]
MTTDLKTASVLAFERKLDPSDALLFSGAWAARATPADWRPIKLREKSVRGTISNRLKVKEQDPTKLDAAIENPNLQTVDVAALPLDADTLKVQFTLRVLGGTGTPSACNDTDYREKLTATVAAYVQQHGFDTLAQRYAANLANGRFLWRNRIGAEQVEVQVAHLKNGVPAAQWAFQAHDHSLRTLRAPSAEAADLVALSSLIATALAGSAHLLLQVTAFVRVGAGQEVFPSQELILDKGSSKKSKTLYAVGDGDNAVAAIHSQKIGNALRTIDTWYPEADDNGPIAVEPYGSVTTQGKAYRQPKAKLDFYNLLDNWVLKDKLPEPDQQHFVIATLIRGGVFGDAG